MFSLPMLCFWQGCKFLFIFEKLKLFIQPCKCVRHIHAFQKSFLIAGEPTFQSKKTRILQFLSYTLATFTEYTVWGCLWQNMQMRYLPLIYAHWQHKNTWIILECTTTTHIPSFIAVFHIELWIFDFVVANQNKYANEVLNMHNNRGHG